MSSILGGIDIFTDSGVRLYTSDVNNVVAIRKLLIYDRWGELVARIENFQPNIPELGWDGYFLGKPVNPAVFAFVAEVELIDGSLKTLSGDVTVLR